MAARRLRRPAPRLHQCPLQEDGAALLGEDGNRLIRRTAVVRTRMPGGVGGAAPRGAPLSRLTRTCHPTTIGHRGRRLACIYRRTEGSTRIVDLRTRSLSAIYWQVYAAGNHGD